VRRKLATYSLALGHEDGGPKAALFALLLGITPSEIDHLEAEIRRGVVMPPVFRMRPNPPHGVSCGVLVPVRGVGIHRARVMHVTTGWELRYVGDRPRLVTAYIKGK